MVRAQCFRDGVRGVVELGKDRRSGRWIMSRVGTTHPLTQHHPRYLNHRPGIRSIYGESDLELSIGVMLG